MDQAPFVLARVGVEIAPPQIAVIVSVFQVLHAAREAAIVLVKKLDGALVLFASIDEELLFITFALEGDARHLRVEHQGDRGGENEDEEEGEAAFGGTDRCLLNAAHAPSSSTSGRVCWFLLDVSSTTAEFTPMRMIL